VIVFSNMGGHPHLTTYEIFEGSHTAKAIAVTGNLSDINLVRDFWQLTIQIIEEAPHAVWINLTSVNTADTKLAACIVAIIRRADLQGVSIQVIGSQAVEEIMALCKLPTFRQFTAASKVPPKAA